VREAISKRKKIFEKLTLLCVKELLLCAVEALDLWLYDPYKNSFHVFNILYFHFVMGN